MDTEYIIERLKHRFAEPLPEFHRRRILFWQDEEGEFADQIDGLTLEGVRVVRLTERNCFAVKKLLCADDRTSNFLVYDTRPFLRDDDNWLINVQLYSETFRADLISIWMDEMGLANTVLLRNLVKQYRTFFQGPDHRWAVKQLRGSISGPAQLHLAVMAVLCGNTDLQHGRILRSVLRGGLAEDKNSVYQSLLTFGAEKPFWKMVEQATGFDSESGGLSDLAVHLLLTASSRTLHQEHLAGLEPFFSIPHQAWCYDFVSEWLHSGDSAQLYETARFVEEELYLHQRFSSLLVEDLVDTEVFPCVDECILTALMKEISAHIIQAEAIRTTVEKRRTMVWYEGFSSFYEGLAQVANLQAFYLEHAAGFHVVEPENLWDAYTTDYYRMDTCYRLFHVAFQSALKRSHPLLDDLFKQVAERAEGLYAHWFLAQLGQSWSDAAAADLERFGKIPALPQQRDFYRKYVEPNANRVVVIISDALRYEVAAELAEQLRQETQSEVTLKGVEAIFPTVTKYGMAALLPHKTLTLTERSNGELAILADGQYTGAAYRDKVLKGVNPASMAINYRDFITLTWADRTALVKGTEVVYLYHDRVDEASHISISGVFPACEEAIAELKNLVRMIVSGFIATHVLITADHGFLYTYSPLREDGKVDKTTPGHQDVEIDRRYLITRTGAKPDDLLPVRFIGTDAGYEAWAPRENVRIRKHGGGLNYVHGGISLQEMVVPVIDYHFLRSSTKAYQRNRSQIDTKPVALSLLSVNRKVSNMIFSLNFYQKEAVGGNRAAATYLLSFTDAAGQRISDTQKIIADRTSDNPQERTFRCSFHLRSQKYSNLDSYYLVIADETGLQMPIREEFQIDIAFAVDEFNFFD